MILSDDAQKKGSMVMIKIGESEVPLPPMKPGLDQEYMDPMMVEAASEVLDAMKQDAPEDFAVALKNFIMACEYGYDD